jgi:hypothetical protein
MSTPEQKIAALEAEIDGYTGDLKAATENDEKRQLRELIVSFSTSLSQSLSVKSQQRVWSHSRGFDTYTVAPNDTQCVMCVMLMMRAANLLRIPTPTHGGHGPLFFSPFWGVTLRVWGVGFPLCLGVQVSRA